MPLSPRDILVGIIAPALGAMIMFWLGSALSRRPAWRGGLAALAAAVGIGLGCWSLGTSPLVPKFDRDWLPYAAIFALVPGWVFGQRRSLLALRWLSLLACIGIVAWLMVPTWETLSPPRTIHIWVWSLWVLAMCVGYDCIAGRLAELPRDEPVGEPPTAAASTTRLAWSEPQFIWLGSMIGTLLLASALLALSGSLRFGQSTAVAMAAYAGLWIGILVLGRQVMLRGAAWVFAVFIAAALLTGKVNSFSSIPTASYMLLPLAPLACGFSLTRTGSVSRRLVIPIGLAVLVAGAALGLAVAAEFENLTAVQEAY